MVSGTTVSIVLPNNDRGTPRYARVLIMSKSAFVRSAVSTIAHGTSPRTTWPSTDIPSPRSRCTSWCTYRLAPASAAQSQAGSVLDPKGTSCIQEAAADLQSAGPRAWAEHAAQALRARGIEALARGVLGHAAGAIQAIGDEINADIVVLGARAHLARNRPLGSTSRALLRATGRPILLVRTDWMAARLEAIPGPPAGDDRHMAASSGNARSYGVPGQ